jgi:intracellular sulfur oxidation DsrE/DsrF family protein
MSEETISELQDLTDQYFEVPVESVSHEKQLEVLMRKHRNLENQLQDLQGLKADSSNSVDLSGSDINVR